MYLKAFTYVKITHMCLLKYVILNLWICNKLDWMSCNHLMHLVAILNSIIELIHINSVKLQPLSSIDVDYLPIPREATSVAMSIEHWPDLNSEEELC